MKRSFTVLLALLAPLAVFADAEKSAKPATTKVRLKTNHGDIVLELNKEKAPITVTNFVDYVKKKHYDGTVFHRVIDGFMIQGGGFESKDGTLVEKPAGKSITNEGKNGLKNARGTIAMARTNDPNSAKAQFFINVQDNAMLDYPNNGGYAVFGSVVEGMDVVDKIKSTPTGTGKMKMLHPATGDHMEIPAEDVPAENVVIESAILENSRKIGKNETPNESSLAYGSGFAITSRGHIITNFHVVEGAKRINVRIQNNNVMAELLVSDQANDLALIKISESTNPIQLGFSNPVSLGDETTVGGFPNPEMQGLSLKLTKGIISAVSGFQDDIRHFQIDAAIQPGNSGGPLVSKNGQAIGVVNAKLDDAAVAKATGSLPQNVNYAVKIDYVKPLLANVKGLPELITSEAYPKDLSVPEITERSTHQIIASF